MNIAVLARAAFEESERHKEVGWQHETSRRILYCCLRSKRTNIVSGSCVVFSNCFGEFVIRKMGRTWTLLMRVWLWKRVATMVGSTLMGQLSRSLDWCECDGCGHKLIQKNLLAIFSTMSESSFFSHTITSHWEKERRELTDLLLVYLVTPSIYMLRTFQNRISGK